MPSANLRALSAQLRLNILRTHARAGFGHLGSSLSIVEILTVLSHRFVRWQGRETDPQQGDRLVLSKGHAALALYCALESAGRIPSSQTATFCRNGSALEAHPNENLLPDVDASTGSLGQGLSIAVGLALGSRLRGTADRTFAIIGDGEANEGQIWEAARSAVALRLSNLIVVLDDNGMQQDGPTPQIMAVPDLAACWSAMGWQVAECDGHNCDELAATLETLIAGRREAPSLVRARTIKGRGVDFLEHRTESHYPPPLTPGELAMIEYELNAEAARA